MAPALLARLSIAAGPALLVAGCQTAAPAHSESSRNPPGCILAFPGAEGAGACSAGGRGGKTLWVTNLDDDGPGSLRAAVDADGPRIVRFKVAGTIRLASDLIIRNARITIDGRGGPGQGIAIADHGLDVKADDVVIRYIRSRLGDRGRGQGDAITLSEGRRIILDHVSASWSVDETLSVSARYDATPGIHDVTVQWSIISESLRKAGHLKGEHGYGSLIRGGRGSKFSFHHNVWAFHVQRMPRPGNYEPKTSDPEGATFEFRSNVFYDWGGTASGYNADTESVARYAFVDNCYMTGPDTRGRFIFREENPHARSWFSGNTLDGKLPRDQRDLVTGLWNPLSSPPEIAAVRSDPAPGGCARTLADAGASAPRDSVDRRVIAAIRSRSGQIIDSQDDIGGWPDLTGP